MDVVSRTRVQQHPQDMGAMASALPGLTLQA